MKNFFFNTSIKRQRLPRSCHSAFVRAMFDIQVAQSVAADYYFRVLRYCEKTDQLQHFIDRWLQILHTYSQLDRFVGFETRVPLLNNIQPHAVGLLIVPFQTRYRLTNISIIPLYPFRVRLEHKNVCCREGIEMIRLYLQLVDVEYIGFLNVSYIDNYVRELRHICPRVKIYGPDSYAVFKQKCREN